MADFERRTIAQALTQAQANKIRVRLFARAGRDGVDVALVAAGTIRHLDAARAVVVDGPRRTRVRLAEIVRVDREDGSRWWPRSPFPPPTSPQDAAVGGPRPLRPPGRHGAS